jgi:hypothetical protein
MKCRPRPHDCSVKHLVIAHALELIVSLHHRAFAGDPAWSQNKKPLRLSFGMFTPPEGKDAHRPESSGASRSIMTWWNSSSNPGTQLLPDLHSSAQVMPESPSVRGNALDP